MNIDGRSWTPVVDGILVSRTGQVHRNCGLITQCGFPVPPQHHRVEVSDLQAHVHKLPICTVCYPPASSHKNRG